jgi:hypothetical protein
VVQVAANTQIYVLRGSDKKIIDADTERFGFIQFILPPGRSIPNTEEESSINFSGVLEIFWVTFFDDQ